MAARTKNLGVRVQEVYEIEADPKDEVELRKDPAGYIKRLLEQEGHKVNKVEGSPQELIEGVLSSQSRARRGGWFHTVYDLGNPGDVCVWHYYYY